MTPELVFLHDDSFFLHLAALGLVATRDLQLWN